MNRFRTAALAMLAVTSSAALAQRAPAQCDRACLIKMVDTYLAAVVAHDPSRAPVAADVKFVEDIVPMKPGEGLWKTASEAPTTFKIFVADPTSGQVGFFGVMKQWDKPIILASRLKVVGGKITEIENVTAGAL